MSFVIVKLPVIRGSLNATSALLTLNTSYYGDRWVSWD